MSSWIGWLILLVLAIFGIRFIVKAIAYVALASIAATYF